MGREIKRVPLDFDWPLNKTWGGFLNPHRTRRHKCATCDGSGQNPETKQLSDSWYSHKCAENNVELEVDSALKARLIARAKQHFLDRGDGEQLADLYAQLAFEGWQRENGKHWDPHCGWGHHLVQSEVDALVREGRLMDFTHRIIRSKGGWTPRTKRMAKIRHWWKLRRKYEQLAAQAKTPAKRVKLARKAAEYRRLEKTAPIPHIPVELVNEWSKRGFGHDAINHMICVRARAKRLGVYGRCAECGGSGDYWESEEARLAYEAWEETPPPEGEGWQVWETVSEGSPVTPVFATPEELIEHLVEDGISRKAAEKFVLEAGWVPSAMSCDGKVVTGIEVAAGFKE